MVKHTSHLITIKRACRKDFAIEFGLIETGLNYLCFPDITEKQTVESVVDEYISFSPAV